MILEPGIHANISERDYHADQLCAGPTLSCSLAKTLIDCAPLHAWCAHPRLGNKFTHEATPEQEAGSASHKLCLGKGADIAIFEGDSWRGNEAKAFREGAREAGHIPMLAHKMQDAEAQRDAFLRQLGDFGLRDAFDQAVPEVVVIYDDGGIRCRAMLDKLFIDEKARRATIFDLKNCTSAKPGALGRLVFNQHYDMQEASYRRGLELVRPDLAGRIDFVFAFLEIDLPFLLTPYQLCGEQQMLGTSKWTRAWQTWEACLKANVWPGYTKTIVKGEAPEWGLASEMGAKAILPK